MNSGGYPDPLMDNMYSGMAPGMNPAQGGMYSQPQSLAHGGMPQQMGNDRMMLANNYGQTAMHNISQQ